MFLRKSTDNILENLPAAGRRLPNVKFKIEIGRNGCKRDDVGFSKMQFSVSRFKHTGKCLWVFVFDWPYLLFVFAK